MGGSALTPLKAADGRTMPLPMLFHAERHTREVPDKIRVKRGELPEIPRSPRIELQNISRHSVRAERHAALSSAAKSGGANR